MGWDMAATRRRGAALEEAILTAGWDQLVADGYHSFTFEAVAKRAGTGKAALYRRWADKEALLLGVLAHRGFGVPAPDPDTGSLREDVLALLRSANRFGDSAAALYSTILGAYFDETETTPAQLRAQLLGDRSRAIDTVIRRAIVRGEISADPLPPRIASLPFDLFRHELMMTLARVPEETLLDIVDTVFLPLVTRDSPG